ncbi:MAG: DUF211 domain-containing protein [Candidatus Nezhaarchaeales archaeon]
MDIRIKRLVIDALKSRECSIIELSKDLCATSGTDEVNVVVTEVDAKTETIRITMLGGSINYEEVAKVVADHGATIKSIDEVNVYRLKAGLDNG